MNALKNLRAFYAAILYKICRPTFKISSPRPKIYFLPHFRIKGWYREPDTRTNEHMDGKSCFYYGIAKNCFHKWKKIRCFEIDLISCKFNQNGPHFMCSKTHIHGYSDKCNSQMTWMLCVLAKFQTVENIEWENAYLSQVLGCCAYTNVCDDLEISLCQHTQSWHFFGYQGR